MGLKGKINNIFYLLSHQKALYFDIMIQILTLAKANDMCNVESNNAYCARETPVFVSQQAQVLLWCLPQCKPLGDTNSPIYCPPALSVLALLIWEPTFG